MLLQDGNAGKGLRRWFTPMTVGLLAFAVVVAGVGLRRSHAQAPEKKPDPNKTVEENENELLLDYARNLRFLLNDLRRDNFENPYGIYRPRQPGVAVGVAACLPTPLGASVDKVSPAMADQLDLKSDVGLVVCRVNDGSPAAKAGLRSHDVLLEVGGKGVSGDVGQFLKTLDGFKVDTPFDATVLRKGKKETIKGLTVPSAKTSSDARPGADPVRAAELAVLDENNDPHVLARQVAALTAPMVAAPVRPNPNGAVQTTSVRTGDTFTTRSCESGLCINVTGKVADGNSKVAAITVRDGAGTVTYPEVDQVPEKYRTKVQSLVQLNDLSNLRVTLKKQ